MSAKLINSRLSHSAIQSTDTNAKVSRMGLIAKSVTSNGIVKVTEIDKDKNWFSLQILIPNPKINTASAFVQIYVSKLNTPLDSDLYTESSIEAGATFTWGDMRLDHDECIFVKCNMAGLPIRVEGYADGRY